MEHQDITYAKEAGIATITLNRPDKMNALTPGMFEGIYRWMEESTKDDEVKVIVITGTGRAFSSGADVAAMANMANQPQNPPEPQTRTPRVHLALLIQNCGKPVIAAMNGVAVGVGLDLALACDIRIASDRAQLCEGYIRRGMLPAAGSAYFLPRLVGIDRALLISWTADMIDAREAEKIGLVTMVVPHEELASATRELAEKLAQGPTIAVQKTKRAIYDSLAMDLKTSLDYTAAVRRDLLKSQDFKEGTTSFVEKRAPVFKGEQIQQSPPNTD